MNYRILRLAGFFGILSPLVGFGMVALSISFAPWFSWTGNALSDLGAEGLESVIFNSGLPMTGALMMMFSTGLFEMSKKNIVGTIGSVLHLLAAFFLVAIGVANINIRPWHLYVSVGFFVTLPLCLITIGVFHYMGKMKFFTLIAWAMALLAGVIWIYPWKAVAIPEALSAAFVSVWQISLGVWMFTRKSGEL